MLGLDLDDIAYRVPGAVYTPAKGEALYECAVTCVPVTDVVDVALFEDGRVLTRTKVAGVVAVCDEQQLCLRSMASWFAAERLAGYVAGVRELLP